MYFFDDFKPFTNIFDPAVLLSLLSNSQNMKSWHWVKQLFDYFKTKSLILMTLINHSWDGQDYF